MACARRVACSPRRAACAVRPYASEVLIASATRSPPNTRPVTLATIKTAISRVETGQLLSERRTCRRAPRRGFPPVCRPEPGPLPPGLLAGGPAAGLPLGGVLAVTIISAPAA